MADVYFFDERKHLSVLAGLEKIFHEAGLASLIKAGDRVAVKVHMGERGNTTHVRPQYVAKIVELVKGLGGKPFVTDTTTIYPEGRFKASQYLETAAMNGFTEATVKAPIIIADGEDGYRGERFPVRKTLPGFPLKEVEVAEEILKSDVLLVVSHFKGHRMSGVGGAIKHLAMGCTTKRSKAAQHAGHGLTFDPSKCNRCMECVKACPYGALEESEQGPVHLPEKCTYCLTCMFTCPNEAYNIRENGKALFQEALAQAAFGVVEVLKSRGIEIGYLSFLQDITLYCDCVPAGSPVVGNIGLLASLDPVALDKASLDLVDRAKPLLEEALKVSPPDIIGKINEADSLYHIRLASQLGLGELEYRLMEVKVEERKE
ncbi:4Fe-4S ferredoxin [Candidatus Bathyarchaeota archaeon]|nr:MAG: 4Fe-4S ferredoxin [Candidatus Hecatellales archaeon]RLI35224.1 MAG: 4Fe-4S ferredoxin [Candidatus Bathyarchaeota archaeon]